MVSIRCKMVVKAELEKLGLHPVSVELGEVELNEELSNKNLVTFKAALLKTGLEIMDDQKAMLVEKVKNVIVEMIHYEDELPKISFSVFLSEKLGYDYTHLSNLFSEVKGATIAHYIILHKIERAKELIMYDKLNLNEIAFKLHYSSAAHLSAQFKKITGLTPSFFKKLKNKRRRTIESL